MAGRPVARRSLSRTGRIGLRQSAKSRTRIVNSTRSKLSCTETLRLLTDGTERDIKPGIPSSANSSFGSSGFTLDETVVGNSSRTGLCTGQSLRVSCPRPGDGRLEIQIHRGKNADARPPRIELLRSIIAVPG